MDSSVGTMGDGSRVIAARKGANAGLKRSLSSDRSASA
jgi:hypothetical protein